MKAQAFRTISGASKCAEENDATRIIKAGDFYIVQDCDSITELAILDNTSKSAGCWTYNGFINLGHLERLQNGNWATAEVTRYPRVG